MSNDPPWKHHLAHSFDYLRRAHSPGRDSVANQYVTAGKGALLPQGDARIPIADKDVTGPDTILFGVGTGRCGTQSLSRFLNLQPQASVTHERHIPLWGKDGMGAAAAALRELQSRRSRVAGDVCFCYLPHLRLVLDADSRVKVLGIRRDREETVASYIVKAAGRNLWMRHDGTRWKHDAYWMPRFPKYDVDNIEDALRAYWTDYYDTVTTIQSEYPGRVLLVETEDLNDVEGIQRICAFANVSEPVLTVGMRTNAGRPIVEGPSTGDHMSIVVITHKKGQLLRHTLDALLPQLQEDDEVLVIDDGGFDQDVVAPLLRRQLAYCPVPHYGYRLSLMCNLGTVLARNPKVVKIDGDCMPQPGWVEYMRRQIGPSRIVAGRILWRHPNGSVSEDPRHVGTYPATAVWGGSVGYLRDEFLQIGGFAVAYNGIWGAEDEDLGRRYVAKGGRVVPTISGAAVVHQWHPGNPLKEDRAKNHAKLQQRIGQYGRGVFPDSEICRPRVHALVVHLGIRPYEQTLRRALASAGRAVAGLNAKIWVVCQATEEPVLDAVATQLNELGIPHELIVNEENQGLAAPKAQVAANVKPGEMLFTLDDDMVVPPNSVRAMIAVAMGDIGVGAVVLDSPRLALEAISMGSAQITKSKVAVTPPLTRVDHTGFGCSLITGKALQECAFEPDYFVGGVDLDFSMQLKRAGLGTVVLSSYQASHDPGNVEAYRAVRHNPDHLRRSKEIFLKRWGVTY